MENEIGFLEPGSLGILFLHSVNCEPESRCHPHVDAGRQPSSRALIEFLVVRSFFILGEIEGFFGLQAGNLKSGACGLSWTGDY